MKAPAIDLFLKYSQQSPLVSDPACVEKLDAIFNLMCALEEQGDDEQRKIWIEADRGSLDDYGRFEDFRDENIIETMEEFKELWLNDYPDQTKWYSFYVARYAGQIYLYFDLALTFSIYDKGTAYRETTTDMEFIGWLYDAVHKVISGIMADQDGFNAYIAENLPYQKRFGRILREDYWSIFPDERINFNRSLSPETIDILKEIVAQSTGEESALEIRRLTAGEFFRYCELGYDANGYFDDSNTTFSPKEKYLNMADGRDCGLRNIDGDSEIAFRHWYENERFCGGHPWEIFRGSNSTHISLFVGKTDSGWLLRLEGSSHSRVIETVRMAVALFNAGIRFILHQAPEIFRMVTGQDYIGIVPETIVPRYCHSHFSADDRIIDFMHLGTENKQVIIAKAFWYPEIPVKLKRKIGLDI